MRLDGSHPSSHVFEVGGYPGGGGVERASRASEEGSLIAGEENMLVWGTMLWADDGEMKHE